MLAALPYIPHSRRAPNRKSRDHIVCIDALDVQPPGNADEPNVSALAAAPRAGRSDVERRVVHG